MPCSLGAMNLNRWLNAESFDGGGNTGVLHKLVTGAASHVGPVSVLLSCARGRRTIRRKEEDWKAAVGRAWSGTGHVGPAEGDGELQVLLLLEPEPPQPVLLLPLALLLGPFQLLLLTSKLEQGNKR